MFSYFLVCEISILQGSVGKYLMKLRVTKSGGEKIDFKSSALRNLVRALSTIPALAGYFYVFFNEEKKTFHDILSHTRVVNNKVTSA